MSTRQLSVMLFIFSFRVTVTSCYLLRGMPVVAEEFFVYFRPTACKLYDFSKSFTNYPLPTSSIGSPPTLPLALI